KTSIFSHPVYLFLRKFSLQDSRGGSMLYKPGNMITCGQFAVDYIIVDDEEVKSHLKKGWVKTPEETATKQKVAKAEEDGENEG
ncbi:hypothetical protein P2R69_21725, partial [Escherichia coli]